MRQGKRVGDTMRISWLEVFLPRRKGRRAQALGFVEEIEVFGVDKVLAPLCVGERGLEDRPLLL
jgi:hypothetical protein